MHNYERKTADTLRSGDTLVMFNELTGDPYTVGLRHFHKYENGTIEWHTDTTSLRLVFDNPQQQEVMLCR